MIGEASTLWNTVTDLKVPLERFGFGENKYRVTYNSEYVSAVNTWKWTQANCPEHACRTSSDELEGEFADVGTPDFVLETDWVYAQQGSCSNVRKITRVNTWHEVPCPRSAAGVRSWSGGESTASDLTGFFETELEGYSQEVCKVSPM